MYIRTFASGSTGNCSVVSSGSTHLLLDAGISARRITQNLELFGIKPSELTAVLITHEHSDHINGLRIFLKKNDVPVYAPELVAEAIRELLPEVSENICSIPIDCDVNFGTLDVRAFETPHDTPQSAGYRISSDSDDTSLGYCTDLGHVSPAIIESLTGVDLCMLECNHDLDMLRNGAYPPYLKRRILSNRGHLSNNCCAEFAVRLAQSGSSTLILAHLSRENNRPDIAGATVCRALAQAGLSPGRDVAVYVAPDNHPLDVEIRAGKRRCSV